MLSTWFALASLGAIVMLLACHGQRHARPRLIVVLNAVAFTAAGLALLAASFDHFQAGTARRFGHSSVPATRAGEPLYFWISTVIVTAAGAVLSGFGLYLSSLSSMRQRQVPKPDPLGPTMRAHFALPERLLVNPDAIRPNFRGADFGCSGKRVELLALARHLASTPPVFSKAIFAAALDSYNTLPNHALADGVTSVELAEIAEELFALEGRQRSDPPERADYHYRMLILYGPREAPWRDPALLALVDNAHRMDDAVLAAHTMRFVLAHAAPSSAARALAWSSLSQFLKACEEPPAAPDGKIWLRVNFLVACTDVQDDELSHFARTVYWERAARCRARNDHRQFMSLMRDGMVRGQEELAQQAMAQFCREFSRLLDASIDAATRAVTALHSEVAGSRAVLVAACLERVVPQLAAADPDAPARAWRERTRDEWWM